ncbi:hypothetical protein I3842_01G167100 [Carya illinoinensis]|uniref:Secreted protein n=1 Tax=Carya illinoinensis TaxID=32201 RepID=A0A922G1E3_CARIL|nr:hypothetical protein I3842_01G167100 [Carya illinoinensis]
MKLIPFSAFWLRSSVVSVLISLISDTWSIGPHDIKFIFVRGESITVACCWGFRASPLRCTMAWAWRTLTNPIQRFSELRDSYTFCCLWLPFVFLSVWLPFRILDSCFSKPNRKLP